MTTIEVKNIGPIKDVQLTFNKINVFMGPQSSGKSTIAKIISYCSWVEKDMATGQSLKTYQANPSLFKEHIENFHKMKGYFRKDSYILYKSEVLEIKWENEQSTLNWVNQYAYKRSKIAYIPSERNIVILPEARKVEFGNTNVRSFLFDWFDARKKYPRDNKLSVLNLDVDYYFVEGNSNEEDHIKGLNNGIEYDILLSNASSGLQSITPLVAMIEYLTKWVYNEDNTSFEREEKQRKVRKYIIEEKVLKPYFQQESFTLKERSERIQEFNEKLRENNPDVKKYFIEYRRLLSNLFTTQNSQFIIEEPEQNLFPETQRDLVYLLLEKCLNKENNRLTITTHSPYILYALNNCMLGGLVSHKMNQEDKGKLKCLSALIKPENVSAYQICDGKLKRIQQEDKLIGANFFDKKMKELMDDFYVMLNYYGK
jgi:predicted ATPase